MNIPPSRGEYDCLFCGKNMIEYPHKCKLFWNRPKGFFLIDRRAAAIERIKKQQYFNGNNRNC